MAKIRIPKSGAAIGLPGVPRLKDPPAQTGTSEYIGAALSAMASVYSKAKEGRDQRSAQLDKLLLESSGYEKNTAAIFENKLNPTVYREDGSVDYEATISRSEDIIDNYDSILEDALGESKQYTESLEFKNKNTVPALIAYVQGLGYRFRTESSQVKGKINEVAELAIASYSLDNLLEAQEEYRSSGNGADLRAAISSSEDIVGNIKDPAVRRKSLESIQSAVNGFLESEGSTILGQANLIRSLDNGELSGLLKFKMEKERSPMVNALHVLIARAEPENGTLGGEFLSAAGDIDELKLSSWVYLESSKKFNKETLPVVGKFLSRKPLDRDDQERLGGAESYLLNNGHLEDDSVLLGFVYHTSLGGMYLESYDEQISKRVKALIMDGTPRDGVEATLMAIQTEDTQINILKGFLKEYPYTMALDLATKAGTTSTAPSRSTKEQADLDLADKEWFTGSFSAGYPGTDAVESVLEPILERQSKGYSENPISGLLFPIGLGRMMRQAEEEAPWWREGLTRSIEHTFYSKLRSLRENISDPRVPDNTLRKIALQQAAEDVESRSSFTPVNVWTLSPRDTSSPEHLGLIISGVVNRDAKSPVGWEGSEEAYLKEVLENGELVELEGGVGYYRILINSDEKPHFLTDPNGNIVVLDAKGETEYLAINSNHLTTKTSADLETLPVSSIGSFLKPEFSKLPLNEQVQLFEGAVALSESDADTALTPFTDEALDEIFTGIEGYSDMDNKEKAGVVSQLLRRQKEILSQDRFITHPRTRPYFEEEVRAMIKDKPTSFYGGVYGYVDIHFDWTERDTRIALSNAKAKFHTMEVEGKSNQEIVSLNKSIKEANSKFEIKYLLKGSQTVESVVSRIALGIKEREEDLPFFSRHTAYGKSIKRVALTKQERKDRNSEIKIDDSWLFELEGGTITNPSYYRNSAIIKRISFPLDGDPWVELRKLKKENDNKLRKKTIDNWILGEVDMVHQDYMFDLLRAETATLFHHQDKQLIYAMDDLRFVRFLDSMLEE